MVSPRIWVSCAVGENAQQGMALAQRLISDLRKAGAEVVSESVARPDEQVLPFLQRELASCQWFIVVQTPQGMGSRHTQLAIQEALSRLKGGLLRGAFLVSTSPDGWDEPAPWPAMRSYTYNGDYPRLRDKLLLDLNLLQISDIQEEAPGDATMGILPLVQETPGFPQQVATGSAERPAPFQERSGAMYKSPSPFQSSSSSGSLRQAGSMAPQHVRKTTGGDRPARLSFSLPRPSRRFWLYSVVSIFSVVLIVSGVVLAKDMAPTPSPVTHPTHITFSRPTPTHPVPTQPPPTQPAPTQPPPTQPPPPSCGPAVSDNFQGNIAPGWTWVDPTNQASNGVTTPGTLSITAPPNTDLNSNTNFQAPRLLQSISGNFTLETQVEVPANPPTSFWAVGLVIWQDQNNFFRVELNTTTFDFEQELNGVFSHNAPAALAGATITTSQAGLRIQRSDNTYSAYYRLPGQSWQLINTVNVPFQNLQAGLDLVNVGGSQFTAYFHYFSVTCN